MDPSLLIPALEPVPSAPIWFESLRLAGFFAHLLLMNAVLGLSLIAFALETRAFLAGRPEAHGAARRGVAHKIPTALALAVNFGVVPLLFLQVVYGQFFYVSSVLIARHWLMVVGLVMLAYYGLYAYDMRRAASGAAKTGLLAVVVGCLLSTAFIYVNNMTLMLDPARWSIYFERPNGALLNLGEPTLWPRYLHFVLGATAVGGLLFSLFQQAKTRSGDPAQAEAASRAVRVGLRWFGHATFFQLLVGLWFLLRLPAPASDAILGGGAPLLVFVAGIACGVLGLLFAGLRMVWAATWATLATLLCMVALREFVRAAYLAPYFKPADLPVAPQYSPMVFFFVSLAVGLAVIAWMLRLAAKYSKDAANASEGDAR